MSSRMFAISVSLLLVICVIPASGMMENENSSSVSGLDDQHVKLIINLYGSNDDTEGYEVTVSREKFEELREIFNETLEKLEKTDRDEEIREIFNDTVIKLKETGILPGNIDIKMIQRLLTKNHRNSLNDKRNQGNLRLQYSRMTEQRESAEKMLERVDNRMCLVCGYAENAKVVDVFTTGFIPCEIISLALLPPILLILFWDTHKPLITISLLISSAITIPLSILFSIFILIRLLIPFHLFGFVCLGIDSDCILPPIEEPPRYKADGKVWTKGLDGIKIWEGRFYGTLFRSLSLLGLIDYVFPVVCARPVTMKDRIGALGFTGLNINILKAEKNENGEIKEVKPFSFFIGSALVVGIKQVD